MTVVPANKVKQTHGLLLRGLPSLHAEGANTLQVGVYALELLFDFVILALRVKEAEI